MSSLTRKQQASDKVTHLSLAQVLVWSQQKGGEERLQRSQVGKETIGTEQEGRVERTHVGAARHDLRTPLTDDIPLLLCAGFIRVTVPSLRYTTATCWPNCGTT